MKKIGVLAIQGDFERHIAILGKLGLRASEVRTEDEIKKTDALIIPGGESTTFLKLFKEFRLEKCIKEYAGTNPIMGTCAGCIILSKEAHSLAYKPLGLIDIVVERNAYGRQRESFIDTIDLNLNGKPSIFQGVFIRAPKIIQTGQNVKILAKHKNDIALASEDNILVATFHPELTDDYRIHKYFVNNFI